MFKTLTRLLCLELFALALPLAAQAKTFYWISHGSPPIRSGPTSSPARMWAKDRANREHLVPSWRRAVAAGSDPRRHRGQGRRHRHDQPRSGQPGES